MAMEIEIVSRETIKPSSPTPHNLKTLNLSFLDQIAPNAYIPMVLFYSTTVLQSDQRFDHLKYSLSETLTHMYPLAGRVKNDFSVDCNDQGANYIRARVFNDMSTLLKNPSIDLLRQLLPCTPESRSSQPSDQVLLAVQVNDFKCGGTAIGVCIWHVIADGSSMSTIIKTWADIALGQCIKDRFVFDHTQIFVPQNVNNFFTNSPKQKMGTMCTIGGVSKRFVFDGSKIAELSEETAKSIKGKPTRVETVSAFIWAAVIEVARERNKAMDIHMMRNSVGLRKRMNRSLPCHSIGNMFVCTLAVWSSAEKTVDNAVLLKRIRESIRQVNDDYVRKVYGDNGDKYLDFLRRRVQVRENVGLLKFTSWCRFGLYEADFGWGRPIWVGNAMKWIHGVVLMDTRDGDGIEAWIGLPEEDMDKLEQNHNFLSYVSLNPSVV